MNRDRMMDALGKVREDFIEEAAPAQKQGKRSRVRWIAAAIAVAVMLAFSQTAPGAAALELVQETISDLIETLFPPKDMTVTLEGERETAPHEAGGQEPALHHDGTASTPGFAIYYDAERYSMTEEHGAAYIRQTAALPTRDEIRENNQALLEGLTEQEAEAKVDALLAQQEAFYTDLPACEMEILHLPDIRPADAARAARAEAAGAWESVTEVTDNDLPAGYSFRAASGENWDSPREEMYFTSDGQGGTFKISVRYFLEAAEGHGARFMEMLRTFEVIAP